MNYELALKLKQAKFPQSLSKEAEYYIAPNVLMHRKDVFQNVFHDSPREATTTNEFVYKPRLEELINELGLKLAHIENVRDLEGKFLYWRANYSAYLKQEITWTDCLPSMGKTPTEAVANLWLKLHE